MLPNLHMYSDWNMAHFFFTTILLHSFAFLLLSVGAVDDHILFPNQHLTIGHTLTAQNQVFQMGFFSPGKSLNTFLGIWYKSTPAVVVWVANRNNPITHSQSQGVVFMISGDGSLVVSRGESIIWSASSSGASNPVLQLLDTGNLVLVDDTTEGYIWQSFDHPTDTMLPGMKMVDDTDAGVKTNLTSWRNPDDPSPGDFVHWIQNQHLPDLATMRGKIKVYRVGQWNGVYFSGGPSFPNELFDLDIVFKEERLISMRELYEDSILKRVTLDSSGSLMRYTMNARKNKWSLARTLPQDTCDEYGICGPNGFCRSKTGNSLVKCRCLKGFAPKYQKDWDLQDWSGGCIRTKPLNCEGGDGFVEVRGVKYPDMLSFWFNTSISLSECKVKCLKNCTCTAYANSYISNEGIGCSMWFSDLIDIKELIPPDSKQNIYIRVPVSEQDFSTGFKEEEKDKKLSIRLILISIASGVLVSAIINGGIIFIARRKRRAVRGNDEDLELPVIKMATIVRATNNFSRENKIGVGGFGLGSYCGRHGCYGRKTIFWS